MSKASRGHARERQVRKLLEAEGWWCARAAGSLGDADIVALRYSPNANSVTGWAVEAMLVEVKATAGGPYERFGPRARAELIAAGVLSGARPVLAYWPPRKPLRWIGVSEWPAGEPERCEVVVEAL